MEFKNIEAVIIERDGTVTILPKTSILGKGRRYSGVCVIIKEENEDTIRCATSQSCAYGSIRLIDICKILNTKEYDC